MQLTSSTDPPAALTCSAARDTRVDNPVAGNRALRSAKVSTRNSGTSPLSCRYVLGGITETSYLWGMPDPGQPVHSPQLHVLGRETEFLAIDDFLAGTRGAGCLVLTGDAGIGKTSLWEEGLASASQHGYRVLVARASPAEVDLPFFALADLIEGIDPRVFERMPERQRETLAIAVSAGATAGTSADSFAIAASFLGLLRLSAAADPILIALDDVQWLDSASASCLVYAARRLGSSAVCFVLTRRSDHRSELERVMSGRVQEIRIEGLSFGATSRAVSDEHPSRFSHRTLRRIYEASGGNPLYALEFARLLAANPDSALLDSLPLPDMVEDIFGTRIRQLSRECRQVLLAVALSGGLTESELDTLAPPGALQDAYAAGLLVPECSGVRAAHPLLAAASRRSSSARERQRIHRRLATSAVDPIVRARHLALATSRPDEQIATMVALGAELAERRGAIQAAQDLAAHALRLTPEDAAARPDRILALGRSYLRGDDMPRVRELLSARIEELPPGRARATAHLLIGEASELSENIAELDRAILEAGDDDQIRSLVLAKKSRLLTGADLERMAEAEALARSALQNGEGKGTDVLDSARTSLAWACVMRGRPIDELALGSAADERDRLRPEASIDRASATRLAFRGEIRGAREIFERRLTLAIERSDFQAERLAQQQLCELELRCGKVRAARDRLDEVDDGPVWMSAVMARLEAVLAATTGQPRKTARWAVEVLEPRNTNIQGWDRLEATRALALAALFEGDHVTASQRFLHVWDHMARQEIDDPGAFPVAGDLVEALTASGDIRAAKRVSARLRDLATEQRHPWGLATGERCQAMIALTAGHDDASATVLADVADRYGSMGLHFDRARTLLFLGVTHRRARRRGEARRCFEDAGNLFHTSGAHGWAAKARDELARVSGRRSVGTGELTPSEAQVARLAASGMSNREIAASLVISVNTVEAHLTHVYAKLGIRSRAGLREHTVADPGTG